MTKTVEKHTRWGSPHLYMMKERVLNFRTYTYQGKSTKAIPISDQNCQNQLKSVPLFIIKTAEKSYPLETMMQG